jgi:hypothetical protein
MPIEIVLGSRPITNAVSGPSAPTPPRRAGSVRRTSTIDMTWPAGLDHAVHCIGRCRDLLTPSDGGPAVALDAASLVADMAPGRVYERVVTDPARPQLDALVGARGGGGSRTAMGRLIAADKEAGSPLYLLMDDLPAAALISGHIHAEWTPLEDRAGMDRGEPGQMDGICAGHVVNASAHDPAGGIYYIHQVQAVAPLDRPDDPLAWHEHAADIVEPSMRRARRIDAWIEDDTIVVDAFFQDSAMTPSGVRVAVHEYVINAVADRESGILRSLTVDPRVLPFDECPNAVGNAQRLVGQSLDAFRSTVIPTLPGVDGCTHLNDMLRALAEVPRLSRRIA